MIILHIILTMIGVNSEIKEVIMMNENKGQNTTINWDIRIKRQPQPKPYK